jgi:putative ABC transport system permease protein
MKIFRLFKMAFESLKLNKMRTFLSMLGVIVGVSSLILITSFGYGAQDLILSSIQSLGSDVVLILPGANSTLMSAAIGESALRKPLTYDDVKFLKQKLPGAKIAPELTATSTIKYENTEIFTTVVGSNEDILLVSNYKLQIGRGFTAEDISSFKNVCILGHDTFEQLFKSGKVIDNSVKLLGTKFTVIGVLETQGAFGQMNLDQTVFVPITSLQTITNKRNLQVIYAKAPPATSLELFGARLKRMLMELHGMENFTIRSEQQYLQLAKQVTDTFTVALTAIGSVALIVGGIGIMNIMLASVAERTREIGIRKAVGAKNRDILVQFLIESSFISAIGGIIGILFGVTLTKLVPKSLIPSHVTLTSILVGFIVSLLIGVFFGVYPARRASRLNPVEALRYQ